MTPALCLCWTPTKTLQGTTTLPVWEADGVPHKICDWGSAFPTIIPVSVCPRLFSLQEKAPVDSGSSHAAMFPVFLYLFSPCNLAFHSSSFKFLCGNFRTSLWIWFKLSASANAYDVTFWGRLLWYLSGRPYQMALCLTLIFQDLESLYNNAHGACVIYFNRRATHATADIWLWIKLINPNAASNH